MFLAPNELTAYYPKAAAMDSGERTTYLQRANAFCKGAIGGVPPEVDDGLKTAVALAFEILAKDETGQVDSVTGNITDAAPAGIFVRRQDPLDVVREMLQPYARAYDLAQQPRGSRGMYFV